MQIVGVKIVKARGYEDLPLPAYETHGAAAMDLRAAIIDAVVLRPGQRAMIPVGISIGLPEGYEAQIRARSGLARLKGLSMVNGVGTIDSDYRGEISALLINHGKEVVQINRGERIAQMVIAPVIHCNWVEESLDNTTRGNKGFGSTGDQ